MIVNIQALRALAALLVVCVHMAALGSMLGWPPRATAFGNCGVDLFFVISGFIMMHTVMARPTGASGFLLNRIVRVVPLYWLMTLAVFGLALATPSLLGDTRADWRALLLSLAFVPFDRGGGVVEPLFFLGWTLNYEMFFYACFALALWVARGRTTATMLLCGGMILACVTAGWLAEPTGLLGTFYTNDLMLEFVFGMIVARIAAARGSPPAWIAVLMVGAGLVLMVLLGPWLHAPRWAVSGVAATLVLLGAIGAERRGLRASARIVQAVGAASYALYLTHPFVMQAFGKVAARLGGGSAVVVVLALAGLGAAIAVALTIHKLVELPITHALHRAIGHRRAIVERADPLATKARDKFVASQ
jgi:exopolysaccharide production protein ExoZ